MCEWTKFKSRNENFVRYLSAKGQSDWSTLSKVDTSAAFSKTKGLLRLEPTGQRLGRKLEHLSKRTSMHGASQQQWNVRTASCHPQNYKDYATKTWVTCQKRQELGAKIGKRSRHS